MTRSPALFCRDRSARRQQVRKSPLFGFDELELGADGSELRVSFLGRAPALEILPQQLCIDGGQRIRGLRVVRARIERADRSDLDDHLVVTVDRIGDLSTYRLSIVGLDSEGRPTDAAPADFDPRYASVWFRFRPECPDDLDCGATVSCEEAPPAEPAIDYLAKDYASFRRLMLDRLALLMPDWQERHVPDLGITLVELLAYVGDQLSYQQDAVATEAYLDTCRQRISVRRHARLVDYRLHEGCNARAWVTLAIGPQPHLRINTGDFYVSGPAVTSAGRRQPDAPELIFEPLDPAPHAEVDLYAAHEQISFHTWGDAQCCLPRGATSATLLDPGKPPTTEADAGPPRVANVAVAPVVPEQEVRTLHLRRGDVLIFEEVRSPTTGAEADADHSHRHAVRLTSVTPSRDPLTRALLVEVEWCPEDALPFALCLSAFGPPPKCELLADVSVARGNVILVDHGGSVDDDLGQVPVHAIEERCANACHAAERRELPGRFRPLLPRIEVTHARCLPPRSLPAGAGRLCGPAAAASASVQDPRQTLPQVRLTSYPAAPNGEPAFGPRDLADPTGLALALAQAGAADVQLPAGWLLARLGPAMRRELAAWAAAEPRAPLPGSLRADLIARLHALEQHWEPRADLLASGPDERHFVVEVDDERRAWLRFGNGDCGRQPDAGESFHAHYRVGQGPAGLVAADALTRIEWRNKRPQGNEIRARNPLAATGGIAPEPVAEARLRAPHLLRQRLERAITASDYAAITMRDFSAEVQRAAATLRWDGMGPEVLVAIDARGRTEAGADLLGRVERHLQRYRRIGHALQVAPAQLVALEVALHVCVKPGFLRAHVKAALQAALGSGRLPGGGRGFFHPDRLSFGEAVFASAIVAAAQSVEGVDSVEITHFQRLGEGPTDELEKGRLTLGALEVARLDNDPNFPEHGRLTLNMEGGR